MRFFTIPLVVALTVGSLIMDAWAQSGPQLPPELQKTAESVIGGQINAFRAGDHEQAYSYAAPSIRQIFGSTDRFIGMVKKGYGPIYGARNWSFGRGEARGVVQRQSLLRTRSLPLHPPRRGRSASRRRRHLLQSS